MTGQVAIIGAGYVGLPLALRFAQQGIRVTLVDVDKGKVDALNNGESYINEIPAGRIAGAVRNDLLLPTTEFTPIQKADSVIVCVPTPLTLNREPDLHYVLQTASSIGTHLQPGQLISLESTTYPGTTSGPFRQTLEQHSGKTAGKDFHLAFSPEREDPGNPESRIDRVPKIVGGLTEACQQKAVSLYSAIAGSVIQVGSCEIAEAAKLLENIFRSVNIALVNELKVVYDKMGIDIWQVIEAAKTKPFGFMPFYPGPGLGGHCIPIDPFYLTWKAREFGAHTRFIELAGEINCSMPQYVLSKIQDALNHDSKAINGSRILLLGLAYKPDVNDCRESPSFELIDLLHGRGAEVSYYDPFVPSIPATRGHPEMAGQNSIAWDKEILAGFDLAVVLTHHTNVAYDELLSWVPRIVDTRNIFPGTSPKVTKA
jgi:UDP-N-acetyl-D-glucosamine dehydrogenase